MALKKALQMPGEIPKSVTALWEIEGEYPDPCCFSEDMAMATAQIVARSFRGRDQ